jgi:hypothetical protein
MHWGLLGSLRARRRVAVHAVVLALVLPLLLGLAPPRAVAGEAALARDIAASFCGSSVPGELPDGGTADHPGHGACILCASCAVPAASTPGEAVAALLAPPRPAGGFRPMPAAGIPPPLRALLDASPPRGPPAPVRFA